MKVAEVLSQAGHWKLVAPIAWLTLVALAFLHVCSHLYRSQICSSLGEVKPKRVLHVVHQKPGDKIAHSALPAMGTLSSQGIFS